MGLNGLNRLLIQKLIVFKFLYDLMLIPTAQQTQQIQQTQQHNTTQQTQQYGVTSPPIFMYIVLSTLKLNRTFSAYELSTLKINLTLNMQNIQRIFDIEVK